MSPVFDSIMEALKEVKDWKQGKKQLKIRVVQAGAVPEVGQGAVKTSHKHISTEAGQ